MKALALPRSFSGSTSIAIPSTATSCTEAPQLTANATQVSSMTLFAGSGIKPMVTMAANNTNCAMITQGRRRPIGRNENLSMMGPATSLNPQGNPEMATNMAIFSGLTPCPASQAGSAILLRPMGRPWAT